MAQLCFDASRKCAQNASWEVEGVTVSSLGLGPKPKALPILDYDDLLYLPMLEQLDLDPGPPRRGPPSPSGPLRWVFTDESQDNSRIRLLMLQRLAGPSEAPACPWRPGCRVFAVGDPMQALYGWAFALPDALGQLFELFGCALFKLPVCRRCPRSHIELANEVIKKAIGTAAHGEGTLMQSMPNAPTGAIQRDATFVSHPLISTALVAGGAAAANGGAHDAQAQAGGGGESAASLEAKKAILARRNAPLLALLFILASKGTPCRMLGRQPLAHKIGKLLSALRYDGRQPRSLDETESSLDGHVRREQERTNDEAKGAEYSLGDLAECVRLLIGVVRQAGAGADDEAGLAALRDEVQRGFGSAHGDFILPRDQVQTVELATVHKAKGLGWEVVYLLEPLEIPLSFVIEQGGWEARQEYNVEYVAYTRSKRELVFLRNAIPQGPKPEGFSLHDALKRVLWEEDDGEGGASSASAGPSEHPRDRYEWSANGAFDGWRDFHQQRAAADEADTGQGDEEALHAEARQLLELPPLPAQVSERDVDVAFRRMAMLLHPDRCKDADAKQRMQAIVAARERLKDTLQRNVEPGRGTEF